MSSTENSAQNNFRHTIFILKGALGCEYNNLNRISALLHVEPSLAASAIFPKDAPRILAARKAFRSASVNV